MKSAQSDRLRPRQTGRPEAAPSRLVLTIDRTDYVVSPLPYAPEPDGRAYRLIKADGAIYDLAETCWGPRCDCPDYIFRRDGLDPSGCKHVKALVRYGLIAGN